MRPILALNCLLQIEQERSEEESSVGDALALAFRCARFCSASLFLFASFIYLFYQAPLLYFMYVWHDGRYKSRSLLSMILTLTLGI